ncbi:MAG: PqqD family protein [Acidimicrobiia bacterium]
MERELKLKSSDLEWVSGGDETVILDDASEQYFATNSAGSLLWEALKNGATHSELTGLLVDAFEVERSQARADVTSFVAELDELGMLE